MKRPGWFLGMGLLLASASAQAGWGEENVPLYEIMWQNIEQTLKLREVLSLAQEATDLARETAGFARSAVQVTRNVQSVINDPARYFGYALSTWYDRFPELHATLENAYTARGLFEEATHPDSLPAYDVYAYNRAFDALTMMTQSGFEVMAHAVDTMSINDPHDRAIEVLKTQYRVATENLEGLAHAINRGGLTPMEASVWTAQATSVTAVAQVQATATLEGMSRILELQFASQEKSKREAQIDGLNQDSAASRLHLKSWHLDPMRSRLNRAPKAP